MIAQGISAFGQDAQRLGAKPASPVAAGHAPPLLSPSYRPWLNHTSEDLRTRWSNQSVYLNRETRS